MIRFLILFLALSIPSAASEPLTVTFLANEGFLLQSGDDAVIIDGFVSSPYSIYGALSDDARSAMLERSAPFEDVTLALASHKHADHFQRSAAKAFLEAHPETTLVSSPDVANLLPDMSDRVERRFPSVGERSVFELDGIRVTFINLPHGGERWRDLQNLGHIIEIGGRRIVHIGDADASKSAFDAAGLADERFDVALIPYWYFDAENASGRARVANHLRANIRIACHVPPRDAAEVRETLKADYPGVRLLDESLDSLVVD